MDGTEASSGRWKKKVISFSLLSLMVTFALIMLGGQLQQGGIKTRSWSEPSAVYQSRVSQNRIQETIAKSKSPHARSSSDENMYYNENDVFADSVVDLPVEGAAVKENEQMTSSVGSFLDSEWWMKDESEADFVPLQNSDAQTKDGSITQMVGSTTHSVTICDKCCYRYVTIDKGVSQILSESELKERGCERRLPGAMIFGVKKGGTTALKNVISYHPDIAFTQTELKFFTKRSEVQQGVEYYRSQMIFSTPEQISMEKTPAYSFYLHVPKLIKKMLPNIKLIIIMRDPVERAVSDYVHMQVTIAKNCMKRLFEETPTKMAPTPETKCRNNIGGYYITDTFEESVIDSDGEVNATSQLIDKGVYVKQIKRYLEYFRPEQILALDGEAFINDPYPAVKRVEQFLGIRDYFTRDHFYFDDQKGFYCLTKPIPNNCMKRSKGRPHPEVKKETLVKLRDYYRPYNKALQKLMKMDLHWSS